MSTRDRALLVVDGGVNLLLGGLLLAVPNWLVRALGAPPFATRFYPSVLGGVLVGIALALFIEARRGNRGPVGLGLGGAIAVNVCGAGVLVAWLAVAGETVPVRGRIILSGIAAVVLGIAAAEVALGGGRRQDPEGRTG